jgi:hypothetical protein
MNRACTSLFLVTLLGCVSCSRDVPSQIQVNGPTPYSRCLAGDPPKSEKRKVANATLTTKERALVIEGLTYPIRIAAFSGPAFVRSSIDLALKDIQRKKPDLAFVLGGIGDDELTAIHTLTSLSRFSFPSLVLAGGRDSWPNLRKAFSSLDKAAQDKVVNLTPMRSIRVGRDIFIPVAGAADGRYALDEKSCGFEKRDLDQIADELGSSESERRWLLSWEIPAVANRYSVGHTGSGVEVGNSDLGTFAKRIHARGGLFAWPYVQVMRPYSSKTGNLIQFGVAALDLHVVVPRLVGPAMERDDGSYLNAGFAFVQLTETGLRVESPQVNVQVSNKSAANSPVKPSAPVGPARMVLAVPDEPARGRKPVLRDELAAVVAKQQYPRERLPP